jgi:hypothetical protein
MRELIGEAHKLAAVLQGNHQERDCVRVTIERLGTSRRHSPDTKKEFKL